MTRTLVQRQFGARAAAYATSDVHARGASLGRLVELVAPRPHWQALDIATGAGHTAAALAAHVRSVVASDITGEMLDETRRLATARGLANMETAVADAGALPFADATFDLVTCRIAAHHFPSVARFVAEARRVLRPGGTFALVDNVAPDALSISGFSEAELGEAAAAYNGFERLRDPSHGRCLGLAEWSETIAAAGLDVLHREILPKAMEFAPWAARMGADAATSARLLSMLEEGTPALKAFLRPRRDDRGALRFILHEAIVIARHGLAAQIA